MTEPLQGRQLNAMRVSEAALAPSGWEGLTQIAVAERLPFSRQTLSDILQGLVGISTETSEMIQTAITAGIPSSSENGKV